MHYCIHVFTVNFPSNNQLREILNPFEEEAFYSDEDFEKERPAFLWDCWRIGGRYGGSLKLKVQTEKDDEYRWNYYMRDGEQREGRLFYSRLLEMIRDKFPYYEAREEDWVNYMGDGTYLYVDGGKIKDLVNVDEIGCFGFVDIDGTAYAREFWTGDNWEKHDDFDNRYQETLKNRSDCFLTIIDIHN